MPATRRDMIHTTGVPRMASDQPSRGEPDPADEPVKGHRFEGVRRAARVEPAHRSVQRRDHLPVRDQEPDHHQARQPDDEEQHSVSDLTHDTLPCPPTGSASLSFRATTDTQLEKSLVRAGQSLSAAAGRARTTTSYPRGCAPTHSAAAWRSLRLTRFRVTAFPTFLPTMKPTREGAASDVLAPYSTTFRRPDRAPERTVRAKSAADLTRWIIGSMGVPCSSSRKGSPCRRDHPRDAWRGRNRLCREFGTALAAARRQDGTTSAGAHAKTETVLLGTTAVIRLKSPLAHCSYSRTILRCVRPIATRGKNRLTR